MRSVSERMTACTIEVATNSCRTWCQRDKDNGGLANINSRINGVYLSIFDMQLFVALTLRCRTEQVCLVVEKETKIGPLFLGRERAVAGSTGGRDVAMTRRNVQLDTERSQSEESIL